MPAITTIRLRRGTAAQWTSANPVLSAGEIGLETDTRRTKYGNGTQTWTALPYSVADTSGIATVDWSAITGKPATFAPSAHTHVVADVTDLTASAAELNVLDGITATTAELNTLDGVTASAAEINVLDGITASTAELNALTGLTASTAELNILDGVTATHTEINVLSGITATTAELNVLDGITASTAELNILDGATVTHAELNVLDGITASTVELNYVDGVTSAIQTQLDGKAATSHTHTLSQITDYVPPVPTFTNTFMLMGA